jgi:hypothetical protein
MISTGRLTIVSAEAVEMSVRHPRFSGQLRLILSVQAQWIKPARGLHRRAPDSYII